MAVLLLGEVTNGVLKRDATARAVGAVAALGAVTVLCAGAHAKDAAAEAATIAGVAKVLVAEDARYGHRLAEPTAALLASLAGDYDHIAAPATTDAKNVMPRVAAMLDVSPTLSRGPTGETSWVSAHAAGVGLPLPSTVAP